MNRRWSRDPVPRHVAPPKPLDHAALARLAAARGVPAMRWTGQRFEPLTPDTALGDVISAPSPGAAPPGHPKEGTDR